MDDGKLPSLTDYRRYSLHLKNPKRNVFVTQLGDQRYENEDVNYIPIIRQAAGEILASDRKTPQATLVLKKEVEVDQVNAELAAKRQEFLQRMEAISQRRAEFERKEQVFRERALKFDKFLRDNDAKRCRAIKKYHVELKENEVKKKELQDLLHQFEEMKVRQRKLQRGMSKYKLYEDYLLKVIDNLPENYLEYSSESMVMSIIRKHETLGATNEALINNLSRLSDEMEQCQRDLESLHQEYDTTKLTINSQLSVRQMECDEIKEKNKQIEMKINLQRGNFIHKSEGFGALLLAINNLADQCYMRHYGVFEEIDMLTKLDMVKEFIMEKKDVAQEAGQTDSASVFIGISDQIPTKSGETNQLKPQIKVSFANSSKIITNQKNRLKPINSKS
ncbi:coiled-coil domain-containing protein 42 homolog [Chiloscyllium plagiosum]|uniref:coiled-coil domain-containing protein 42 homolog n=1 Tax=Chiloscyllium plagiosum TaxID=36176 RepID=UPI001CB8054A|nr:coiled-coil domain-containing protein 42 homolog [Chiloscyllium plagiosum]XP_043553113.1 coiled-coil domain-containing protein 42 homolog [Chiloscyllium plagiosum]